MDLSNTPFENKNQSTNFGKGQFIVVITLVLVLGLIGYLWLTVSKQQERIADLQAFVKEQEKEQVREFPYCPPDNTAPHCVNKITSPKTANECIDASMQVARISPLECVPNNKAFPNNRIVDDCLDWQFPPDIEILRYDPCSSLSLFKYENGREFKANFIFTRQIIGGGKDVFGGNAEQVLVESRSVTRYISDLSDDATGLGTYSIDYAVNYDRLPIRTPRNGKELLTAEFQIATKNNLNVSLYERNSFIETVDVIMNALKTK